MNNEVSRVTSSMMSTSGGEVWRVALPVDLMHAPEHRVEKQEQAWREACYSNPSRHAALRAGAVSSPGKYVRSPGTESKLLCVRIRTGQRGVGCFNYYLP